MNNTGKIARLPHELRETLNHRLLDHEPGDRLLAWLNQLPAVQAVLAREFGGKPINKQNLSAWRRGGFANWQAQRELLTEAQARLTAEAAGLSASTNGKLTEHLATVLASHYAVAMARLDGGATDDLQRQVRTLHGLCGSIVALRRGDHRAARLEFEREQRPETAPLRSQGKPQPSESKSDTPMLPPSSLVKAGQGEKSTHKAAADHITVQKMASPADLGPGEASDSGWPPIDHGRPDRELPNLLPLQHAASKPGTPVLSQSSLVKAGQGEKNLAEVEYAVATSSVTCAPPNPNLFQPAMDVNLTSAVQCYPMTSFLSEKIFLRPNARCSSTLLSSTLDPLSSFGCGLPRRRMFCLSPPYGQETFSLPGSGPLNFLGFPHFFAAGIIVALQGIKL